MSARALQLPPPYRLIAYETIGSTSDEAKRLARGGAEEGVIVWAKTQTTGRGRRGRVWESPAGNLYMSMILRPGRRAAIAAQLGFVAALGMAAALRQLAPGAAVRCKWPNDLLANGKKIAGILLETEMVAGECPDFVVIGIGVNLAASPDDTPYPATSLAKEGAGNIAPEVVLACFVERFAKWLDAWRKDGFGPIREAWLSHAIGLGEPIQVRLERDTLDGRFLDLDDDGALMLGMASGKRRIAAGEIFPASAG
ncbi:MAG TPA: biotin--[acetyl-CoA-carboxylase] ligase [Stellaceae bacterium]|nr:biotin--[acetyl-CoA-carboxylase] ligase [Stellaceae bacterium]